MSRIKTGGRQKGTPNKVTTSTKQWLSNLIDNNRAQFEIDLTELEPQERIKVITSLLPYVIPKAIQDESEANSSTIAEIRQVIDKINGQQQ